LHHPAPLCNTQQHPEHHFNTTATYATPKGGKKKPHRQ